MSTRSWTQLWVHQVTSGRFRNFSMPRSSLLKSLRAFSKTNEQLGKIEDPVKVDYSADKGRQLHRNPAYNAPFNDVDFTAAKAADVKQRPGYHDTACFPHHHHHQDHHHQDHHHQSCSRPTTTTTTTSTASITNSDGDSSSGSRDSNSDPKGRRRVVQGVVGALCFLALLAVVAVALYFKLYVPDDPDPVDKEYVVELQVTVTNHQFQDEMTNQSSQAFQDFEAMFRRNMTAVFSEDSSLGRYRGCSVYNLSQGSVVTTFALFFSTLGGEVPGKARVLDTLTRDAAFYPGQGTVVLPPGLGILMGSAKVLRLQEVPHVQFVVPGVSVTTQPPASQPQPNPPASNESSSNSSSNPEEDRTTTLSANNSSAVSASTESPATQQPVGGGATLSNSTGSNGTDHGNGTFSGIDGNNTFSSPHPKSAIIKTGTIKSTTV
ncbi:uncharacterized protein LOC143289320 [Babylonia areolata]|uniref:uncharacterized protein LOC143289320 n=1 Tax=Babylonia areolata TaxID=304850 RepID=UPI003FD007A1